MRRLIQIRDGHPETIGVWLAFLRKHAYYGIGMKANVWHHERLGMRLIAPFSNCRPNLYSDASNEMDIKAAEAEQSLGAEWDVLSRSQNTWTTTKVVELLEGSKSARIDDAPLQAP